MFFPDINGGAGGVSMSGGTSSAETGQVNFAPVNFAANGGSNNMPLYIIGGLVLVYLIAKKRKK